MSCFTCFSLIFIFALFLPHSLAWDNEELELFDLVEEVNENFYELLGISQDADTKEIKKAFRRLSLVLHPDKNDSPDAEVKFRQLVAVYEALSDEQQRSRYNEVLVNGLPDWKHAVYYYRRVRKMGLLEMLAILLPIVTVGQYVVLWASYAEKKYTAEQFISSRLKKSQKKIKKGGKNDGIEEIQEILSEIPKPSIYDLLPFQTCRFIKFLVTGMPEFIRQARELYAEQQRLKAEQELSSSDSEEETAEERKERKARRRKAFQPPELSPEDPNYYVLDPEGADPATSAPSPAAPPKKLVVGGLWTDDDLTELARLVRKYPGGTTDRWEKIADAMCRAVPEVTHMAKKLKEENYRPATSGVVEEAPEVKAVKVKTKGGKLARSLPPPTEATENIGEDVPNPAEEVTESTESQWSQTQQKALENALTKFPKGTSERWVKIAKCVPEKNVEECILRYKELVEFVKKKKMTQDVPETEEQSSPTPDSECLKPGSEASQSQMPSEEVQ